MAPTNGFTGPPLRARGFAAGIHLGLSLSAVGLLALAMLAFWYPPPYFVADGGWRVLRLIVLVDVVLGPLLTFIVFNRAKPELKRDLAVIALIQVGAFAGGAATMYWYRPAFVAVAGNVVSTVNWRDLERASRDLGPAQALAAGGAAPVFAHVRLPGDAIERAGIWARAAAGATPPTHEAERYEALTRAHLDVLLNPGVDIDALARDDASIAAELKSVLARHPELPRSRLAFVLLTCRFEPVMLVFDRETRRMIDWMN